MKTFSENLLNMCKEKNNRLCIGLDIDNRKLKNDSLSYMEGFIKDIIDSTVDICPVYKINFAFYERLGSKGFDILYKISEYINHRSITIADCKRGDIGNSSKYYADAVFGTLNYDSITVSPYMGEDSISPFCDYKNKGVFILCLTSNQGSENFQNKVIDNEKLYIHVTKLAKQMNLNNNIGLVVGATKTKKMMEIKQHSDSLPWLIPGVGHQGGSMEDSIRIGSLNNSCPIINVSRGIIYAGNGTIEDIRLSAENYTKQIRKIL